MNAFYRLGYDFYRAVGKAFYEFEVFGREHVPSGGALIACNHVSFLDPPMVGAAFPYEIHYLARKTLFSNAFVRWLYGKKWNAIPVDQEHPDFTGLRTIIKLLRGGEQVLLFPEGARSWDGEPQQAAAGVGLIIEKTRVPVLPVRIFGAEKALPRGAMLPRRSQVTIVIGEPLGFVGSDFEGPDKRAVYQALADRTMEAIVALENPRA